VLFPELASAASWGAANPHGGARVAPGGSVANPHGGATLVVPVGGGHRLRRDEWCGSGHRHRRDVWCGSALRVLCGSRRDADRVHRSEVLDEPKWFYVAGVVQLLLHGAASPDHRDVVGAAVGEAEGVVQSR